jgi:benzoyl-CoA reductase subunit B
MNASRRYKTEPLDCYLKAKELRTGHFQDVMSAKEKGKLLISGSVTIGGFEIPAGLGDVVCFADDSYAVNIAADPDFSTEASAAAEGRGFSREICGYTLNYIGSMFLNRFLFGGEFPKPDLIFTAQNCDARGKWSQIVADHLGVPLFIFETPCGRAGEGMSQRIEYLAAQLHEGIEWMERITGREYDDEKLIEATRNFFRSAKLWGEICLLNRAIPAPIDARALIAFLPAIVWRRHEKIGVEFLEILRDELRCRIDKGIAASAVERCRLMIDNPPPYAALSLLHRMQARYGVVSLGTLVYSGIYGELEVTENGNLVVRKTPEERGLVLSTREGAVRALAESIAGGWLDQRIAYPTDIDASYIALTRYLRADAVLLDINRSCPANSASVPERKLAFMEAGFPVTIYESYGSRPRDIDLRAIEAVLERFLEGSIGLSKLTD